MTRTLPQTEDAAARIELLLSALCPTHAVRAGRQMALVRPQRVVLHVGAFVLAEGRRGGTAVGSARAAAAADHDEELVPEAAAGEAVEEEVRRVVDVDEQVVDDLRHVVGDVAAAAARLAPVRLADQQHDARRRAHEEREAGAHAQHRRVHQVVAAAAGGAGGAAPARHHQRPDQRNVTAKDRDERQRADRREGDPRPHVRLEVAVGARLAAVRHQRAGRLVVLATARPEHVRVLRDAQRQRQRARPRGAVRHAQVAFTQREADGGEAVDREGDEDPDGRVAGRVRDELAPVAGGGAGFAQASL